MNINQTQLVHNIIQNGTMGAVPLIFLIISFVFLIIQVTNQVKIQNSWLHNTKILCVKQNASYVANCTCNWRLVSRTIEESSLNINLQPNVVLDNLHVCYVISLFKNFLLCPNQNSI